jgi:hypothetical protein
VPGSAGVNQTYNFSALHSHLWASNTLIAASTGVLGSHYTMTNVCSHVDTLYYYFDSSSTHVNLWGVSGNLLGNSVNNAQVYSNPQTIIKFPSTYNSTFTDTAAYDSKMPYNDYYQGYYVDSVREKERIITVSNIDGWGNVTTPNQTFPCLRQNIVEHSIDSTWAKVVVGTYHYWLNLSGDATSTQSYSYISHVGPIVNIEYYADSNAIAQITWNPTVWTAVPKNEMENDINIFPNPNTGEFDMTMNSSISNDYTIELSNVLGQVIYHESLSNFSGKYNKHFDVKAYGDGFYMMRVFNTSGLLKSNKIAIIH